MKKYDMPNMGAVGLFHIGGVGCRESVADPAARIARMRAVSKGKDTIIGHWEIAGILSRQPLPTYLEGFPQEVLDAFSAAVGRGVLFNRPYSGTEVIKDYGDEYVRGGNLGRRDTFADIGVTVLDDFDVKPEFAGTSML